MKAATLQPRDEDDRDRFVRIRTVAKVQGQ